MECNLHSNVAQRIHSFYTQCTRLYTARCQLFTFNLEKITPGRKNLHRHRLWCLWQIVGMHDHWMETPFDKAFNIILERSPHICNCKCLPRTYFEVSKFKKFPPGALLSDHNMPHHDQKVYPGLLQGKPSSRETNHHCLSIIQLLSQTGDHWPLTIVSIV